MRASLCDSICVPRYQLDLRTGNQAKGDTAGHLPIALVQHYVKQTVMTVSSVVSDMLHFRQTALFRHMVASVASWTYRYRTDINDSISLNQLKQLS